MSSLLLRNKAKTPKEQTVIRMTQQTNLNAPYLSRIKVIISDLLYWPNLQQVTDLILFCGATNMYTYKQHIENNIGRRSQYFL